MIQRQLWAIFTSVLHEHLISYPQVNDYKQQPNKLFKTSPSLVSTKRKHKIFFRKEWHCFKVNKFNFCCPFLLVGRGLKFSSCQH